MDAILHSTERWPLALEQETHRIELYALRLPQSRFSEVDLDCRNHSHARKKY
jgi:hypothetical protein